MIFEFCTLHNPFAIIWNDVNKGLNNKTSTIGQKQMFNQPTHSKFKQKMVHEIEQIWKTFREYFDDPSSNKNI